MIGILINISHITLGHIYLFIDRRLLVVPLLPCLRLVLLSLVLSGLHRLVLRLQNYNILQVCVAHYHFRLVLHQLVQVLNQLANGHWVEHAVHVLPQLLQVL